MYTGYIKGSPGSLKELINKAGINENSDLLTCVPEHIVNKHKVFPVSKNKDNKIIVAMTNPFNVVAIDDLRLITGCEIEPFVATEKEIEYAIQKFYGFKSLEKALHNFEVVESETIRVDQTEDGSADEAPIVSLVNEMIVGAIEQKASDIHIEPQQNEVRVRYRIDGLLHNVMVLPIRSRAALISRIKLLAELNITEKRVPQDGRIKIRYLNRDIDLRIATMPNIFGEKLVIRILDRETAMLDLYQLGFQDYVLNQFDQVIKSTHGMVLLTGPTGSGKTTTLYAALIELNTVDKNIITIEDPVEYILEGVNQTQVNPTAGITFANGLRSILRQDPDIIMVGEIRDAETARIAMHAATTGHLVLSTMHTTDAAGALVRLIEMGIEPYQIVSSVRGVVAQRLLRKICPYCKRSYKVSSHSPEFMYVDLAPDKDLYLSMGSGCSECKYTGYSGRVGIQEVLIVSSRIRTAIINKAPADEIRGIAVSEGMIVLREDGIHKALQGITTVQEVIRTTSVEGLREREL